MKITITTEDKVLKKHIIENIYQLDAGEEVESCDVVLSVESDDVDLFTGIIGSIAKEVSKYAKNKKENGEL